MENRCCHLRYDLSLRRGLFINVELVKQFIRQSIYPSAFPAIYFWNYILMKVVLFCNSNHATRNATLTWTGWWILCNKTRSEFHVFSYWSFIHGSLYIYAILIYVQFIHYVFKNVLYYDSINILWRS